MRITGFEIFVSRHINTGGKNMVASVIAVAGVCCAVVILILTLAVSDGFKSSIREKLGGFDADIVVQPPFDYTQGQQMPYLEVTENLRSGVYNVVGKEVSVATVFRLPGILKTAENFETLIFTGFDDGHDDTFERANMVKGMWPDYAAESARTSLVISESTAKKMNLAVGDRVDAYFFANDNIKPRRFTITGLYTSNFGDYDNTVCYASPQTLRRICNVENTTATALEVRGISQEDAPILAQQLQYDLVSMAQQNNDGQVPVVDNITHTGAVYLNWLNLLDTNVVVIFILMCAVAVFTLISSLFILILNNISTIGILRAVGATRSGVQNIFILVSMKLVGMGMLLGNFIAIMVILLQKTWHIIPLNPEMYYLDAVPVKFNIPGIILINIGVIAVAWLTLILPARLAGKVSPARTMRYD